MPQPIEEKRPSWNNQFEFIITLIGNAVGLGNVWRFPHLAYANGGGAFLIPYFFCMVFLGIPLFCLEIVFGQFASEGPLRIWEINPLFKGFGYTMVMLSIVINIYYNVVVAYAIYFLFASMNSLLPWMTCGNVWNTCHCRTPGMPTNLTDSLMWFNKSGLDCTDVQFTNESSKSSSEEYFYNNVLELTDGIQEAGAVKWDITLCNLLAWLIICVALIKGVKSMGKVVYFSALFPYVVMTILLARGLTLDGSDKGILFYLTPDIEQIKKASVWKAAASQIFFSLATCTGGLTAMASYNKFNNNCLRDGIIIPIINCLTSFYAGFIIFPVLGFMSENYGKDVADVTTSGPGLAFVVYPEALGTMPVPQLWSILFFLMMICLGIGTQFPGVEGILTAFQDEFPVLKRKWNNVLFRVTACALAFLLGLPQTTKGGYYLFDLCDIFVGFPLILVGLLEIVVIVWIYGPNRLSEDIMLMVGHYKPNRVLFYCYFSWNWFFATPFLILAILIFDCLEYKPIIGPEYPEWAEALGWMIVAFIMIWTPLWFLIHFCSKGGARLLISLNQPTLKWGPADPKDRVIPRYRQYFELHKNDVEVANDVDYCSSSLMNTQNNVNAHNNHDSPI